MPDISDAGAREITKATRWVQTCLFEKTGEEYRFDLDDARKLVYQVTTDKHMLEALAECIRQVFPPMGEVAKEYYRKVLEAVESRPPGEGY